MTAAADRHLLLGLLGLQNGIINQGQLVPCLPGLDARQVEEPGRPSGSSRRPDLFQAALCWRRWPRFTSKPTTATSRRVWPRFRPAIRRERALARIGDPEIGATLGRIASAEGSTEHGDFDRTTSYAVGSATSNGQRFRVLRPHARGGLGAVFVALDGELNREVALKQILDHHADDPESRKRFLIEAEITGGLEHPGIVPVYGLGNYGDGRPYYAMRFIKGDSLKEAIERFHEDATLKADLGDGRSSCASSCGGSPTSATRSTTRTAAASCTGTLSRGISSSASTARH